MINLLTDIGVGDASARSCSIIREPTSNADSPQKIGDFLKIRLNRNSDGLIRNY